MILAEREHGNLLCDCCGSRGPTVMLGVARDATAKPSTWVIGQRFRIGVMCCLSKLVSLAAWAKGGEPGDTSGYFP